MSTRLAMGTQPSTAHVVLLVVALTMASCQAKRARPTSHTADGVVVETVDSAFVHDVLSSGKPTVVYYGAFGCIPCVRLAPHVTKLAARYAGEVTFWKLDRGWSAERVRRYEVPVVPTLVFYANQHEMARLVGMPTPATDDSLVHFVEVGLREFSSATRSSPASAQGAPTADSL